MSRETSRRKVKRFSESDLDAATQKAVEELAVCENEIDDIAEKLLEVTLIIERKYNRLLKPAFDKRAQIISKIPNFWKTAFMDHPDIRALLDDSEEDCLHYLTKLEVEEFEDIKFGYWMKFHFKENPYFENAVITKEYHLDCNNPLSKSTQIIWKEGCTLGQMYETNRRGRKLRRKPLKTFFGWFNDDVNPFTDHITDVIKEGLWLSPLRWYCNKDGSSSREIEELPDEDNKCCTPPIQSM